MENSIICSACATVFEHEKLQLINGCRHFYCQKCINRLPKRGVAPVCPYCSNAAKLRKCTDCKQKIDETSFTTCDGCTSKNQKYPVTKAMVGDLSDSFARVPTCGHCNLPFDFVLRIPKILPACKHVICLECAEFLYQYECENVSRCDYLPCQFCDTHSRIFSDDDVRSLKTDENVMNFVAQISKQIRKEEESLFVQCTECAKQDLEKDMHICQGCTLESFGFDVDNIDTAQTDANVDSMAICSTCVLKSHIMKGHKIYEFYPIRASFQIRKEKSSMNLNTNDMNTAMNNMLDEWDLTTKLLMESKNELDRMVNLMIRSKTTNVRNYFCAKNTEMRKATFHYLSKIHNTLKEYNSLQDEKLRSQRKMNTELEVNHCRPKNEKKVKVHVLQHPVATSIREKVPEKEQENAKEDDVKLTPPKADEPGPSGIRKYIRQPNFVKVVQPNNGPLFRRSAPMHSGYVVVNNNNNQQRASSFLDHRYNPIQAQKKQQSFLKVVAETNGRVTCRTPLPSISHVPSNRNPDDYSK